MIELSGICIEADTTALERGLRDAERAVTRFLNRRGRPGGFTMPESLMPKPLNLALTMIPGPGDNLVLALVDRESGRPVEAVEITTHTGVEDTPAGQSLVTVSLLADLVPPFSPLVGPAA